MGRREDVVAKVMKEMNDLVHVRNCGTCAHIDHGKTTLSDSILAGAGVISEELAGKQLFMDFDEQEQARGITINAAYASTAHTFEGHDYLINLIDTPGHVDFGGDVTRAMRALDGAILVVCAVEGVMPQTETVIRQALKERARPVMFINKVDRLINELKVTPEQMQQRFVKIITEVNKLIKMNAPPEFKEKWQVSVNDGSVAFGSAFHKWATSVPYMKKTNISFKDIYDHCAKGTQKELAKKAPIHQVILDMVIKHLPNPIDTQKYKVPVIWHGDLETKVGKGMLACDRKGPLAYMVTKIIVDPHAGEIAVGRVFSGTIKRGMSVNIIGMPKKYPVQIVSVNLGAERLPVDEIGSGNMAAVSGIKDAFTGCTITDDETMDPFEKIVHYSEPVVTVSVEAKHLKDLPKLVEVLRSIAKADPSILVEINQETGEHLMSGMGELHLEITIYRIIKEHGVEITTTPPIVVYRECVAKRGGPFEGKSPNKHNRFYFIVEALPDNIVQAMKEGKIQTEGKIKDAKKLMADMIELGMSKDEAKGIKAFQGFNVLIDMTKGIQYLHETFELITESFREAMNRGPLANEKVMGLKCLLVDAKLHEDGVHRGPAQVIPAVRNSLYGAMCQAGRSLLEPKQKVFINTPENVMGEAIREIQSRRGVIVDIKQEDGVAHIESRAPVAELFGFASAIRSATQGRALWSTEGAGFDKLPRELQEKVVSGIRTRKGLKPEPYDEAYYSA
jgi:elongation factor 2